ncbi:hypothetical protein D0B54_05380 [Solimonas sp. K1W22B-7]|uniref:hypothetical protein n=1 Tax=Solimonas sp. K1W22B-7 TaxID=2303331 RepID=UPI000E336073|nr:hypothetical protein [Solimonas sp. K1W22B-7]AXQ28139.1 hypothetical protein D0B54_05380 [Solimonas sp. K1W22B-7]
MRKMMIAAVLLLGAGSAHAASVPNTFTAGAPAKASEVNANFAALVTAVTALEAKVATLETKVTALEAANGPLTVADVVGSYHLMGIKTKTGSEAVQRRFKSGSSSTEGTVTFAANGTFTASIIQKSDEYSGKAQQCKSVAATTSSFQGHDHQYTAAGCTESADAFISSAQNPPAQQQGGTWVLNAQAGTITLTPSGETPLTASFSKSGRVAFLLTVDPENDPSNPGRSYSLEVLVKQ